MSKDALKRHGDWLLFIMLDRGALLDVSPVPFISEGQPEQCDHN